MQYEMPLRVRDSLLSREDFRAIMMGMDRMRMEVGNIFERLKDGWNPRRPHGGPNDSKCSTDMNRWLDSAMNTVLVYWERESSPWRQDPLCSIELLKKGLEDPSSLRWIGGLDRTFL